MSKMQVSCCISGVSYPSASSFGSQQYWLKNRGPTRIPHTSRNIAQTFVTTHTWQIVDSVPIDSFRYAAQPWNPTS